MTLITEKKHPSHPGHSLELVNDKPYNCNGCKEEGSGIRYRCPCKPCDFDLHKECMVDPNTTKSHRFYEDCSFTFIQRAPEEKLYCNACLRGIKGYYYHCDCEKCDLHPYCRKLPRVKVFEGVDLHLCKKLSSKCNHCMERKPGDNIYTGWGYVSECKKYRFHVSCLSTMIREKWEKKHCTSEEKVDDSNLSLDKKKSSLQLLMLKGKKGSKWGRLQKFCKMAKIVAVACLGDPISIFVSLIILLVQ